MTQTLPEPARRWIQGGIDGRQAPGSWKVILATLDLKLTTERVTDRE
ncbi:hypothetical protein Q0M94_28135 (plasmid) [Deinococcus radiomollis]